MFKLALNAGHAYTTPGKRCLKSIDEKETAEYALNKRICDKIEEILKGYKDISVLRIDDGTEIPLSKRTSAANSFGADFYLSIHHNAGINGGSGGGIEAYTYLKVDEKTRSWQSQLYAALIASTGLIGNRSRPLRTADFHEVRETRMPAVLLECGFMDSTADTPIILSDSFAEAAARAIAGVIAERSGAALSDSTSSVTAQAPDTSHKKPVSQIAREVISGKWGNGDERKAKLAAAGYDYPAVQAAVNAILSAGSNDSTAKSAAQIADEVIAGKWGNGTERKNRLTAAGYSYSAIQAEVNKRLKK